MDDQWAVRVEGKLDRLAEAITTHVAEDKAVHVDVDMLKSTVSKLKTKQDKHEGATAFIGFLALSGLLTLIASKILEHVK